MIKTKSIYTVLIAPLDWGFGHTTRIIPLINAFKKFGLQVIMAGNEKQLHILKLEFPDLECLALKGYNVTYSLSKRWFPFKIVLQLPKIIGRIYQENVWLQKVVSDYNIDLIISDNRYGLYSKKAYSVFITHQLFIAAPWSWLSRLMRLINYRYINRFNECWIPDFSNNKNIAGRLSHPVDLPRTPVYYLGLLSRFEKKEHLNQEKKYHYLFIVSGPEPQRSVFEKKIIELIPNLPGKKLIVLGRPKTSVYIAIPETEIYAHLPADQLEHAIELADMVVSRAGYSTIMDLLSLQKKAILIPTPGQTEQEYLAAHLKKQQWFYSFNQQENFIEQFKKATNFNFSVPTLPTFSLHEFLETFVRRIIK